LFGTISTGLEWWNDGILGLPTVAGWRPGATLAPIRNPKFIWPVSSCLFLPSSNHQS
jgi:hypothetical protein